MKGRFEDRVNEREAFQIRQKVMDFEDPYKILTKSRAFDFYSKQIVVSQTEEYKFLNNIFLREEHMKLQEAEKQIEFLISECKNMHDLLDKAMITAIEEK